MTTHRFQLATAAVLATLALASCSPDKQETHPTTTTQQPPPATTSVTTSPTAPPVTHPLDASGFVHDPCGSLTADQQHDYGVTRAERSTLAATEGESCSFHQTGADSIWIAYASKVSGGLGALYGQHAQGTWRYWAPTDLDGFPALAFGNTDPAACFFAVGVSDALYFWVSASPADTCTRARTVASTVLANIRAAN